jgi:quercetin dioxygenase-like cupin family protein
MVACHGAAATRNSGPILGKKSWNLLVARAILAFVLKISSIDRSRRMMSRRDLVVAVLAASATWATVAWAQSNGPAVMHSSNFSWDELKAVPTATGEKRSVFSDRTATLDQLAVHVTTVKPHERSHDPHRHWEEELIIVKEGTIESMQNGETVQLGPGSVIFESSNELHGLKNVGDTPASYFVIKWFPPGSLPGAKQ